MENVRASGKPADGGRRPRSPSGTGLSRRRVLELGAATGAAALAPACGVGPTRTNANARDLEQLRNASVAVVGGGLAGLTAAYRLKKAGVNATLFEASNRVGGRVWSTTGQIGTGLVTELGGEFINSDHNDMHDLVTELLGQGQLADSDLVLADSGIPREAYVFDGRRIGEEELATALRPLAALLAEDRENTVRDDAELQALDALSVSTYLANAKNSGNSGVNIEPWLQQLVEAAIAVEYGADPRESTALQLLWINPTVTPGSGGDPDKAELLGYSDERYRIRGGNGRLADALSERLGESNIKLGWPLKAIERTTAGYQLSFEPSSGRTDEPTIQLFDHVIVALPFTKLRRVQMQEGIGLPSEFKRFYQQVGLGKITKAMLGYKSRPWLGQPALGAGPPTPGVFVETVWSEEFGAAWDTTLGQAPSGRPFINAQGAMAFLLGGSAADRGANNELLAASLEQGLDHAVPGSSPFRNRGKEQIMRWSTYEWTKGGYTNFKPGQYTKYSQFMWTEDAEGKPVQKPAFGNLVFCGEHLSDDWYGFMNGAAQTGRLAAQTVLVNIDNIESSKRTTRG